MILVVAVVVVIEVMEEEEGLGAIETAVEDAVEEEEGAAMGVQVFPLAQARRCRNQSQFLRAARRPHL